MWYTIVAPVAVFVLTLWAYYLTGEEVDNYWEQAGGWKGMLTALALAILAFFCARTIVFVETKAFWTWFLYGVLVLELIFPIGMVVGIARWEKWPVILIAVGLIILLFPWKSIKNQPRQSQMEGVTTVTPAPAPAIVEDDILRVQGDLTVQKITPQELEALTVGKYKNFPELLLYSSLSTTDKERTEQTGFSDALTFGFTAEEKEGKFLEIEEEILRNPVYGVTVANALRDKKVGDRTLGDLNPWLNEFVQKNENGVFYWLEHRNGEDAIYVTSEYRTYAATLCTLLERMTNEGVQTKQTYENWCLSLTAENNSRKGVKADYQYRKEALILEVKGKNGVTFLEVGFNIHDKRPEFFDDETPVVTPVPTYVPASPKPPVTPTPVPVITPTPTPTPTPVVTPTPTPTPVVTPTPTPTPTVKPTPTPTPTPTPAATPTPTPKDPVNDPVNNGNADKGGGDNKPADGAGDYQPVDPRTENPTGRGNNNNQGHSNPATVIPTTPPVVPSHTAEPVVDYQKPMDYVPDPVTTRGPTSGTSPTAVSGDGEFTPDD